MSSLQTHHNEDTHQCAVCLENIGDNNVTTLECGHMFHYTCIQHWHLEHSNCPCCRRDILEEQRPIYNIPNNENSNSAEYLHNMILHSANLDMTPDCNHCHSEIIICEGCGCNMCFCNTNRTSRNGRNPFDSENDCFTCLECFNNRDNTLIDWLEQSWVGDVFEHEFIIEHYETFYVNNSEQNHPNHRSFNDYHDFIEYAEELLRENFANDVNNQISFEDAHGGFTQEEINDINDMNARYQYEMNNEMNNISRNTENAATHFNEVLNTTNFNNAINEIIDNNIQNNTINNNSNNGNISIAEYNNMCS
jgi:hypothetical protein